MVAELILFELTNNKNITLKEAKKNLPKGCTPKDIPWIVRLLENPQSSFALPGKITLYNHDCLHILLNRGFNLTDEAFVIGFTMGNALKTNWFHLLIFKFFSRFIYPRDYRFNREHLKAFDLGVFWGKKIIKKNINQIDFQQYENKTVDELRYTLGFKTASNSQQKKTIKVIERSLGSFHVYLENFLVKSL